jgi:glycosyltransferase involved in cell wall biosynthesis
MNVVELEDISIKGLNRAAWHKPLVSIIITHYNYSDHVTDALRSLLDQSHDNWECVIVDDASEQHHRDALARIVEELGDRRITVRQLDKNGGQVPAFFEGLERTSGDFICLLDPDDRYAPTFLEEALAAHLNLSVMCPILSTEQILVTEQGVIGAGLRPDMHIATMRKFGKYLEVDEPEKPRLLYVPASVRGWHWTATSALMFRRAALNYLKPHKKLTFKRCADGYLAQGCHALGGTLFLQRGLVYRQLHNRNSWIDMQVYSSFQNKKRASGELWAGVAYLDALEAMEANGLPEAERRRMAADEVSPKRGLMRLIGRWRKSLKKRIVRSPTEIFPGT